MWKSVIAPTVLVSVMWITASSLTTYYMSTLFASHLRIMAEDVTTIESAWSMRRDTWKLQVVFLDAVLFNSQTAPAEIARLDATFKKALNEAQQTSLTPAEQALAASIRDRYAAYMDHIHQCLQTPQQDRTPALLAQQREKNLLLASAVADTCRTLSDLNERMVDDATSNNQRLYAMTRALRTAFLIIGPGVGLFLGLWVARRLNRSLSRISVTLNDASGAMGRELGQVAVSTSDDLPALHRQVDLVADNIRGVVNELAETRQRAIQSERLAAVGELAAGVAHEIRNPLTSVKLLIQTAAQQHNGLGLGPRQTEIVLQEVSRMESLIQDLLDFARPPRIRAVRHDLRQTVQRAMNLIQGRAEQKRVALVITLPEMPVFVNGDSEQLHLVFVNLAINGVQAMATGGTLRVALAAADGQACVSFCDTGKGISPEILCRLFEPFVTSKEGGTGLGLAICHRIVQEHGGTIVATNLATGGAEMTVQLDLAEMPPVDLVKEAPGVSTINAVPQR